jgi:hypothetical protein
MYEPITVVVDRAYGDGTYRPHTITFTGLGETTAKPRESTTVGRSWARAP